MAKNILTNLNDVVDNVISSNVNVIAANQAIADAEEAVITAEGYVADAENIKTATENLKSEVEGLKVDAENAASTATVKADEAAASANEADLAKIEALEARNTAQTYRDDALNYLAAVNIKYDMFDDRWYGGHDEDPITDHDGFAIQEGAVYWNTVEKALKVFDSVQWKPFNEASGVLIASYNLSDLTDKQEARNNLDVYTRSEVDNKDVFSRARANHTGTQSIDTITDSVTHVKMSVDDKTKLDTIEANAKDDQLASEVPVIPSGNLTSENVQDALEEVQEDLDTHKASVAAHGVGVVVGTTESQTLTNKTLNDVSNEVHADVVHYEIQATANITRGQCLVATGVTDDTIIKAAPRSSLTQPVIGIAEQDIGNGLQGEAISTGVIPNIPNSGGWTVGDILYPDATGGFTTVPAIADGNYNQPVAYVLKANPAQVSLIVNVHSGHESAAVISYGSGSIKSVLDTLSITVEW